MGRSPATPLGAEPTRVRWEPAARWSAIEDTSCWAAGPSAALPAAAGPGRPSVAVGSQSLPPHWLHQEGKKTSCYCTAQSIWVDVIEIFVSQLFRNAMPRAAPHRPWQVHLHSRLWSGLQVSVHLWHWLPYRRPALANMSAQRLVERWSAGVHR